MRLCLSCYRMWPRDALFCGVCGRSFGGRVCKRRHLSPPGAHVCVQCGETELTDPTGSLAFGWLAGLISTACLLLILSWLMRHLGQAVALLVVGIDWLLEHLFGQPSHALERWSVTLVVWIVLIGLLLLLLPIRLRERVSRPLGSTLRSIWRFVYRVLVLSMLQGMIQRLRQ